MIFPILGGLLSFRRAPVTWMIVALNLLVLIFTTVSGSNSQDKLEEQMKSSYFVSTQGRLYSRYLRDNPGGGYPTYLQDLAQQVSTGSNTRAEMLGQLAFRDQAFLDAAPDLSYDGDQVAFRAWKKQIAEVRLLQEEHPSFTLGLNADDTSITKWVTYIFVHSGATHFIGNMLFLLIFGAALETQIGGLASLLVFVLSGVFAAGVFALMTGVTGSPLVGASGAVSGTMTLYCLLNWNRPTRYFYWLFLPFRGYMGFVFLPAWVAMVAWSINDIAGYVSSLAELGGVAHTAHIGGELAGVIVAAILFGLRQIWPVARPVEKTDLAPIGVLMPFLPPVHLPPEQTRAA